MADFRAFRRDPFWVIAIEVQHGNEVWMRGLFMLLFMIAFGVAQAVLNIIAVVQFLWLLFADESNQALRRFGSYLSRWFSETVRFLTCANEEKLFPRKLVGGDQRNT